MRSRSVEELPVPILTDDELIEEYSRTFPTVEGEQPSAGFARRLDEATIRRNAAAMGELLRRGYRSTVPEWAKPGMA